MTAGAPLVSAIRRFALDDGPGIRTTVFLKGCPLACAWCHNPESMRRANEVLFRPGECIHCARCAAACSAGAIRMDSPSRVVRGACTVCGDCVEACPATALTLAGTAYPPETLVKLILRDRPFFEASGGGATFSGGEPALHMEYLGRVLRDLKKQGIHTALQTCGLFDLAAFTERVLPYTDLIYFDIKLIDPGEHAKYTGAPNAVILENFRRLSAAAEGRILPRVPLIPGITATRSNLLRIAAFLNSLGYRECALLPYNPGCIAKRQALGMAVPPELPAATPDFQAMEELRQEFYECLLQEKRNTPNPIERSCSCRSIFITQ